MCGISWPSRSMSPSLIDSPTAQRAPEDWARCGSASTRLYHRNIWQAASEGVDHLPTVATEKANPSTAYRQSVDQLIAALGSDARLGLTNEDALSRLERYGH